MKTIKKLGTILNTSEQKTITGGVWFDNETDCINSGGTWTYNFGGYFCLLGELDDSDKNKK